MKTESGDLTTLPQSIPEVRTAKALQENFPSQALSRTTWSRKVKGRPRR
jgi:RND superfamily putative drug exporter